MTNKPNDAPRSPRRRRLTPAFIISVIALSLALMGTAVAAGLAPNSVGSKQIKDAAVKTKDLRDASVNTDKIADLSVANQDLQANAVTTDKIADQTISANDLATNSIAADALQPDSVGNSELAVVVRTNQVNVANNASGNVSAPCAAGETVLSGGGGFPGVPNGTSLATTEAANGGWFIEGRNASGSTQTLVVQAFCLKQ